MVFAPKRTVTTLPAANSVPASALWEMAVTLPVLPPVLQLRDYNQLDEVVTKK